MNRTTDKMKSILIIAIMILGAKTSLVKAQFNGRVGVNTDLPQVTLQVDGNASNNTVLDGIMAPRISGAELSAKTGYGSSQTGAIVYVTHANATLAGQTIDVKTVGYYYFDGIKWVRMAAASDNTDEVGWLARITEGGHMGFAIRDRVANNYGDIGVEAVDLSFSVSPSNVFGATGRKSFAVGENNTAAGNTSVAMGTNSVANGTGSVAIGYLCKSGGTANADEAAYCYTLGLNSQAADYSVAVGIGAIATGNQSVAIGKSSEAKGDNSFAMHFAKATASHSFASGSVATVASAEYATAVGYHAKAAGVKSMAIGIGVEAAGAFSHAYGNYNTKDTKPNTVNNSAPASLQRVFVVGNGSGDFSRHDAFTILQDGRVAVNIDKFENSTSNAILQVNGTVRVGNTTASHGSVQAGTIKYESGHFYGYDGSEWKQLDN